MLQDRINKLYDNMNTIKDETDQILFYAFLSGVIKSSLTKDQLDILEKELAYYKGKESKAI